MVNMNLTVQTSRLPPGDLHLSRLYISDGMQFAESEARL